MPVLRAVPYRRSGRKRPQEVHIVRKLIPLAVLVLAVGVTAALASGGTARHAHSRASAVPLAQSLAAMRVATAKYATNLNRARRTATRSSRR